MFRDISGISLEHTEEDYPPVTPVFQTQLPDDMGQRGAEGDTPSASSQRGQMSTFII
jgi:hypothetical protein